MSQLSNTWSPSLGDAARHQGEGLLQKLLSARKLLVLVFMLVIFTTAARPVTDPDFWWHLKTGEHLLETRSIPYTDMFSTIRFGSEWVTHEWLSEIFMYAIFRALSYAGLIVAFALIITATFWIAFKCCSKRTSHPYISGFALILGAMATMPTWGVRPQMFSMLFASIFVSLLDGYVRNENSRRIWWLAPLMVFWVNMHAGFAIGLALIFLTIAGLVLNDLLPGNSSLAAIWQRVRRLVLLFVICLAAVALNPNGLRLYSYPFETLTSHAMMQYIQEWKSPDFHEGMFLGLAMLLFATFSAMALSKKKAKPGDVLILAVTGLATLRSSRNVPFFALVAMPLLAEHSWNWITSQPWGQWLTKPEQREAGTNASLKMALNILLLVVLPLGVAGLRVGRSIASQPSTEAKQYPAAAVDFIQRQKPPQPIYNEYVWGGYLIWRLYPDYRVYMDGRADVYGDDLVEEFLKVHDGQIGWREPLDHRGIRTVLVKPDAPLASLLREDASWQKVFEDDVAVIFTRK